MGQPRIQSRNFVGELDGNFTLNYITMILIVAVIVIIMFVDYLPRDKPHAERLVPIISF